MITRPSADALRASCLAVNPGNVQASVARRERLLAAFHGLTEDTRADLIEAIESIVFRAPCVSTDFQAVQARKILRRMYADAGME
jgi:hypothetical protein